MTPYADNDDERATRELAITLLTNMVFSRNFRDVNDAISRMIDEALSDPHGQLAQELRQIGVLPPMKGRK